MFKKKSTKIIGTVLALGLTFTAGSFAQAENDWMDVLMFNSSKRLHDKGKEFVKEIKNDSENGVQKVMEKKVDKVLEEKEQVIEDALNEYYTSQIEGLVDSEAFDKVKSDIDQMEDDVIATYKKQIDEALAGME